MNIGTNAYVSIHHMLLFILGAFHLLLDRPRVSIHHMLLFISHAVRALIVDTCFNTSHVTLYPENQMQEQFPEIMFQYITCYSLSGFRFRRGCGKTVVSIHHMLLFIGSRSENWILSARFNTSHVTLYRTSHLIQWIRYGRFNTSHVTLYPNLGYARPRS